MPALAPETSYRVEPAGNEFTDEQFWQAEVGFDKSNDAVDAELKEETVDEGVAEPDAPLEDPDALDALDARDARSARAHSESKRPLATRDERLRREGAGVNASGASQALHCSLGGTQHKGEGGRKDEADGPARREEEPS